ncbi:MAG: tRNA threonylcarbamoyladenosine dehydratase [Oscillospiraceae bacterium]
MGDWLQRTRLLLGEENTETLKNKKVAVLGLGGVGGSCCESLARCGIGTIIVVDSDVFDITNLNRQLLATTENIGNAKCDEAEKRLKLINPNINIIKFKKLYLPDNSDFLFDEKPDFIVDAIDNVTAKLHLIKTSKEKNIPIVTCLGTGKRLCPEKLAIGKIADTSGTGCPLSRILRRELKRANITDLDVVFSTEPPMEIADDTMRRTIPSSSFVPPVAGYILSSFVIRKILDLDIK